MSCSKRLLSWAYLQCMLPLEDKHSCTFSRRQPAQTSIPIVAAFSTRVPTDRSLQRSQEVTCIGMRQQMLERNMGEYIKTCGAPVVVAWREVCKAVHSQRVDRHRPAWGL